MRLAPPQLHFSAADARIRLLHALQYRSEAPAGFDARSPITLTAPVDGLFFARDNRRFAVAGMSLGKVAGSHAMRSGPLLFA